MAQSLEQQLKNYFKSGTGTKILGDKVGEILKSETERMAEILRNKISEYSFLDHVTTGGSAETSISNGSVQLSTSVGYDDAAVHRDSWYPEGYPGGEDLFTLFNYGYDAKNHVFKIESGRIRYSLTHRDPLNFIQSAIDEFNQSAPLGVKAEYIGG